MPRRPPVALLALALAAGCGHGSTAAAGPVTVPAAAGVAPQARDACALLVTQLPLALGTAARRLTAPDAQTTAAWGDPAITLACGGPSGSPLDEPFTVDGIRWAVHDIGAARTWTTLAHSPAVVVTMPDAYQNQGELIGGLSGALSASG